MPTTTASTATSGSQSLFSGDNLRGWLVDDVSRNRVEATGGVLRLTEGAGWLRTEVASFGTFALSFEARAATQKTRAIVAILGGSPPKAPAGSAYLVPLFAGPVQDSKALLKAHFLLADLNTVGVSRALGPTDDWQAYVITRGDPQITASLNRALILTQDIPIKVDGWIGFRTQGGSIELRNIRIDPAPESSLRLIYRPGPGVTLPRVLREARPRYTSEAMHQRIEGTVLLECVVEVDGTVSLAKVIRSLDPRYGLDAEAVRAVRRWHFTPAAKDGQPVPVFVTIELTFTLK